MGCPREATLLTLHPQAASDAYANLADDTRTPAGPATPTLSRCLHRRPGSGADMDIDQGGDDLDDDAAVRRWTTVALYPDDWAGCARPWRCTPRNRPTKTRIRILYLSRLSAGRIKPAAAERLP